LPRGFLLLYLVTKTKSAPFVLPWEHRGGFPRIPSLYGGISFSFLLSGWLFPSPQERPVISFPPFKPPSVTFPLFHFFSFLRQGHSCPPKGRNPSLIWVPLCFVLLSFFWSLFPADLRSPRPLPFRSSPLFSHPENAPENSRASPPMMPFPSSWCSVWPSGTSGPCAFSENFLFFTWTFWYPCLPPPPFQTIISLYLLVDPPFSP